MAVAFRCARVAGVLLAGAMLAGIPAGLAAGDVAVSLVEAMALADERNPEILAQRARVDAMGARAQAAGRASRPRLSLAAGWSLADTPSMVFAEKLDAGEFTQEDFALDRLNEPGTLSHARTTLAAEVPLDVFRKNGARAEALASARRAGEAGLAEGRQELRLRVVEAYRRAAVAERLAEVTEGALAGARARERWAEARVAEGAALGADLLRVRTRRRQREAELAERRAEARIALAVLARLLGAEAGTTYMPVERPGPPPPLEGDEGAWTARALGARQLLRAVGERVESVAWSLRAEQRTSRPDLAAWGQLHDDRNDVSGGRRSGALGLVVRWEAFDPARGRRVAAAAAEARAAEQEARGAREQVRLEVETAWRRAQAARERHAAAAGGAEEGREALRVVRERRGEGLATLTDELETEAASLAAELEELRAASEAAIADAALLRAAGGL